MKTAKKTLKPSSMKKEHNKQPSLSNTKGQAGAAELTRKTARRAISAMKNDLDAATEELEAATTAVEAPTHMQPGIDDSVEYAEKLKL